MNWHLVGIKLLQRASVALALIAPADDVEYNPGFRRLTDIKKPVA